jgi:prepilin-type N-terminal cleavage/methylation domain-containing protein
MKLRSAQTGFSLIELMVAMAVLMIIVAATMSAFTDATRVNEVSTLQADVNQNLRAGMNLMIRDLIQTGQGIPTGGIPIPLGGVPAINRPSPPTLALTFPLGASVLPAVSPGALAGLAVGGQATDIVTVLIADATLPLSQSPLQSLAADGSQMTVANPPVGVDITQPSNGIRPGDLIMFTNAQGNAIQQVTRVSGGQTVFFDAGDFFGFNQTGAPQGTIVQIRPGAVFPVDPVTGLTQTTATRIWMVSYYIDSVTDPNVPRLMRQINFNAPQPVALAAENLQISFDMEDGINTNVKAPPAPLSPNEIRKVNLFLATRSAMRYSRTNNFVRNGLVSQVGLRSLSYRDRYQ